MITQTQEQLDQLAKQDLQAQYDDLVSFQKHSLTLHFGKNTLSLRMNSPRTQSAIHRLGFDSEAMSSIKYHKDFCNRDPNIQDLRYKHYLRKLQQKVREVVAEREQVVKRGVRDRGSQQVFNERQVSLIVNTQNYIRSSSNNPGVMRYEEINQIEESGIEEFDYQMNYQVEKFNRFKHQRQLETAQVLGGMGKVTSIIMERKHKQLQYIQQQLNQENQRIESLKIKKEVRDIKQQKLQEIENMEAAQLEEKKNALQKKLEEFNRKIETEKQDLLLRTQKKVQKKRETQERIRSNMDQEQRNTLAKQENFMEQINRKMQNSQRQHDGRLQRIRQKCQQHQEKVGNVMDQNKENSLRMNQSSLESMHKKISQTSQGLKNLQDYKDKNRRDKMAMNETQRQIKEDRKLVQQINTCSVSALEKQENSQKKKDTRERERLFQSEKRRLMEQDKLEQEQILMTRFENKQSRLKEKFQRSKNQLDYQRAQQKVLQQTNAEGQKQLKRDKAVLDAGVSQLHELQCINKIRNHTLHGEFKFNPDERAKGKLLIDTLLQQGIQIEGDLFAEKIRQEKKKTQNKSQLMEKSQVTM